MTTGKDKRPTTPSAGFVIGRKNFGQISAVEGIRLTGEMKSRADRLKRQGLSPEARRRAIIAAHSKS